MESISKSRFWKVVCLLARTDVDLLEQCNRFDRHTALWTAVALVLAFCLHSALWGNVMSLLAPSPALAVAGGVFVALLICLLELALVASDWTLAGVLRTPGFDAQHAFKLALRIGVALLFSLATATAFELWLHGPELQARSEAERRAANAPLVEELQRAKARLHAERVQPVQAELAGAQAALAVARVRAEHAGGTQTEAARRADAAVREASREQDGLNRAAGRGPRFNDALLRERQARAEEAASLLREQQALAEAARLERTASALKDELAVAASAYQTGAGLLEQRMRADDRYVAARDSLMSRLIALEHLRADPRDGAAASYLHWITMLTLIAFELVLALVKLVFAPASVYTVRLIARAKEEALQVDEEHAARVEQILARRGAPRPAMFGQGVAQGRAAADEPRPPLRVVAGEAHGA